MDVFNPLLFSGCSFKVDKEQFTWHVQAADVRNHIGQRAYVEILDDGDGWVAVDEIRFIDAGWKPPAEDTPSRSFTNDLTGAATETLATAASKIDAVANAIPDPIRVLVSVDGDGFDDRVHVRGNTKTLGDAAPRRFLTAMPAKIRRPYRQRPAAAAWNSHIELFRARTLFLRE